ncbi:cell division ATP-binding protein FtsE [Leucobacter tardus]|uniref:Cell division ATP-binding protein FtsE n=1 Tax=Leucobacter tardus TaxID=501483 RepID=A0A939QCQ6_9MICO|nr:cell division ATP-binding protein FtsE [Leucobacter tardus]MBO2989392.1 cell division ATP-binding protein FtsE [Leucobacter tardus]
MILFENVTKQYRGTQRPALDSIDLKIDRGEFVFIVGASGSGKSSCLQLILRQEQPSSGNIHVLGQDLGRISSRKVPYFRRNLGMVFQDFRLLTDKTVYENVAFSLQVIGKSRGFIQEAVPDTLEMVGLGNKSKRYPHELSGGEQQRVAIARAIVNKPAILMADEPTGNLDPATSLGIMQLLRAINASGTTVVMATHEATFVDIMQQRVVELSQGIVVRDEIGGGYGETASIPVTELPAVSAQVLRTSEEVVRAALAPEFGGEATAASGRIGRSDAGASGVAPPGAVPVEIPGSSDAVVETVDDASEVSDAGGIGEDPATVADDARYRAPHATPPETEAGWTPAEAPAEDDDDLTVVAGQRRDDRIPAFLEPGEDIDPVKLASEGGVASRLGLSRDEDDDTDVGPVR